MGTAKLQDRFNAFVARLKSRGVKMIQSNPMWLQCDSCGAKWSPDMQRGGRMPRGYWKCPNSCNVK